MILIRTCKIRILRSIFVDFAHFVCYSLGELNTLANICLESWPKCLYRSAVQAATIGKLRCSGKAILAGRLISLSLLFLIQFERIKERLSAMNVREFEENRS